MKVSRKVKFYIEKDEQRVKQNSYTWKKKKGKEPFEGNVLFVTNKDYSSWFLWMRREARVYVASQNLYNFFLSSQFHPLTTTSVWPNPFSTNVWCNIVQMCNGFTNGKVAIHFNLWERVNTSW